MSNRGTETTRRGALIADACAEMACQLRISRLVPGHSCGGRVAAIAAQPAGRAPSDTPDIAVVAACRNCRNLHTAADSRYWYLVDTAPAAALERMIDGMVETQARLIDAGIISVAAVGAEAEKIADEIESLYAAGDLEAE